MHKNLVVWIVPLFLGILALAGVEGQTPAPAAASSSSTNAPSATAPAQPIPLGNVVTEAVTISGKLQDIQAGLASDQTVATVNQSLPAIVQEINQRESDDLKVQSAGPTLSTLRSSQAAWQTISNGLDTVKQTLTGRVSQLDKLVGQLGDMNRTWQVTLASANTSSAPPDVLNRIQTVIANIGQQTQATRELRAKILSSQSDVGSQEDRIKAGLAKISDQKEVAIKSLFVRDSAPLWDFDSLEAGAANPAGSTRVSFGEQIQALRLYLADKMPTLFIHLLIFIVLAIVLVWVRRELQIRAGEDPAIKHAANVLELPLATAMVLALLASGWLYPLAPRLLLAGLEAAALIPVVVILRRLIEPALFPILYAMVLSFFVDQVRSIMTGLPVLSRLLFLIELTAAIVFLLWLVWSRRLSPEKVRDIQLERVVGVYARLALALFGVAIIANFLGYTHLSYLMGNAELESSYLAVILYAAVRIADGLIMTALKIRPLSLLGMVQRHDAMLGNRASLVLRGVAALFWLWETLELFSLRTPLGSAVMPILIHTDAQSGLHPALLGRILLFAFAIWATFSISRFIRFVLEEEVYPNWQLGPGVPYAMSTIAHYVVLILGFLMALNVIGVNPSNYPAYTVLAGALGVGLGFGLQNIMNNFVSGIILLFERPIKVGDVIQVDTSIGTVEKIGIRASIIRITNGSEVIMPNGNLISNPVTNWTFSDRRRVIDIPIAVAAKSDPQRVMAILVETAKANPSVLTNPPPQVLFTSLTGATLNFELKAWTAKQDLWTQTKSELFLAISAALARENIVMS